MNQKGAAEEAQSKTTKKTKTTTTESKAGQVTRLFLQQTSNRCFLKALARAPTSFMGFAAAPLALAKLSKPACLDFDVIRGELQTATECLTSCSVG